MGQQMDPLKIMQDKELATRGNTSHPKSLFEHGEIFSYGTAQPNSFH